MSDHYEVLNVERTATTAEIKSAYRRLVRQVHPDQGGNAALFRVVQEAWTTLGDPAKRAAYDRTLDGQTNAQPSAPQYEEPTYTPRPEPEPEPAPDPFTWTQTSYQPPPQTSHAAAEPLSGGIEVVPAFGRWRLPALLSLAVLTLLDIAIIAIGGLDGTWDIVFAVGTVAMIVVAMPPHWSRRIPLRRLLKAFGIVTAVLYFLVLFPFSKSGATALQRVVIIALLIGLVLVRVLTGRWSKVHKLDKTIDATAAYDFNLWGRPGEPLVDDGRTAWLSPSDVLRHRRTARILDSVVNALPASKLVHGARIGDVAVSHLLLNGHRVALISSVVGPPGHYALDAYGALQLNGMPVDSPVSGLDAAVAAWRSRLAPVEVRGFLIVHPPVDGQGGITAPLGTEAAVTCLPAQTAANQLQAWLQPEGLLLDRLTLYDILYRAPYA
ncbi:J domain-containing protein [Kribbella sp. NPDC000426]|uniref:J domain-containing protein n=1 Tax=Kribbella sp. NPDC000426 TaxID=3154255 RepID=UPI003329982C